MPQAKNHLTASTQAKNGSLYAVIQYKDENGKRKNKWKSLGLKEGASKAKINAAMREAVNDFEKELTEILTRSQNPDADMPVFEYMVKWLGSVQPSLQINTYRSYHNMIYGRIKRYFSPKAITIASLRPNQIDEFYQSIFDEGMVANTVIHYHAVMRRAFQQAYKKEILSANPFDRVERPKKNKFFGQNLSEEELLTLLSLARSEAIYPAIILAGCMGLRRSEALGMRWSRIDMEKREVLLDTKVVEVEIDGEKILKPIEEMKNSSSRRSLPIPAPVYEMLVEQKAQQDLYRRMFKGSYNRAYDDYVCTDKLGNLLPPRYVTLRFSQVLEKNGMRHIRFHDLRHPYVKHTTKIFSLRLMDFQAQAYPDARRKTRGACQLHRGGQSQSPVRPLCNRKRFSCLPPQAKMSWILYAISMRLSGYTSTRSISSSASSVVSASASKIALDASLRLSCRACSSCFCFACANTAA